MTTQTTPMPPVLRAKEKGLAMSKVTEIQSSGRRTACVAIALLLVGLCHAAEPTVEGSRPGLEEAAGKAAPARVIDLDLRSLPQVGAAMAAAAARAPRPQGDAVAAEALDEPGDFRDPLVADQQRAATKAASGLTVDVNVAGIGFTGATPADAVGDVGGGRFVQMVNAPGGSVFAVYDTTDGDLVAGPSALSGLWQGAGACAEGWGHPGVVHDALADRWVLSELGAGDHLCVYVSKTSNPVSGGWFAYDFELPSSPTSPGSGCGVTATSSPPTRTCPPSTPSSVRPCSPALQPAGSASRSRPSGVSGSRRSLLPISTVKPSRRQIPAACSCATWTARRTAAATASSCSSSTSTGARLRARAFPVPRRSPQRRSIRACAGSQRASACRNREPP